MSRTLFNSADFTDGDMVKIVARNTWSRRNKYDAITHKGDMVSQSMMRNFVRKKAFSANKALRYVVTRSGGHQWRQTNMAQFDWAEQDWKKTLASNPQAVNSQATNSQAAVTPSMPDVKEPIHRPAPTVNAKPVVFSLLKPEIDKAPSLKPDTLVISDVKWKYLIRSVLRGKNIMMVGPSGFGKTLAAQTVAKVMKERPFFFFNLGATQDPRSFLIGNTHYSKENGTFFGEALFVRAIQTPNAIILLDELSRAHPDAANILMTVLDENQRYLRIDEREDTPTIKVADGVSFIATANIGSEYTAARVMDRALLDRFITIEMDPLTLEQEKELVKRIYPDVSDSNITAVVEIARETRKQVISETPKVSTMISTRMVMEIVGNIFDGFTLAEAAEVCIYPFYPTGGGVESERVFMQQLVQKFLPTKLDDKQKPWENTDNKIPFDVVS